MATTTTTTTTTTTPSPLTETELKTLEQTRQRLAQLTNTLAALQNSLTHSDPLPPHTSLTTQSAILSTALSAYASHLTAAAPLLSRLAAYPTAHFPGQEGEKVGLVQNLLRKKLGGEAEEWVEEGGRRGREVLGEFGGGPGEDGKWKGDGDGGLEKGTGEGLEELWAWAGPEANRLARGYRWGVGELGDVEEEEEEEEEEEDEEDEDEADEEDDVMEVSPPVAAGAGERVGVVGKAIGGSQEVKKPVPLHDMLRFMTTGRQPGT